MSTRWFRKSAVLASPVIIFSLLFAGILWCSDTSDRNADDAAPDEGIQEEISEDISVENSAGKSQILPVLREWRVIAPNTIRQLSCGLYAIDNKDDWSNLCRVLGRKIPHPNFEKQTAIVLTRHMTGLNPRHERNLIGSVAKFENEIRVVVGPSFHGITDEPVNGSGYTFHILTVPRVEGKLVEVKDEPRGDFPFDPFGERAEVDRYGYPKFRSTIKRVDEEAVKNNIPIVAEWHGWKMGTRKKEHPYGARIALRGDDAFVVRDNKRWRRVWRGLGRSIPEVDFEKYMIICATCTSPYRQTRVLIRKVTKLEERIWVDIEITTGNLLGIAAEEDFAWPFHYVAYYFCAVERIETDILFSTRYIYKQW